MKIEYSVISRGTEKAGSKGYMAITVLIDNCRYLIPVNHNERETDSLKDALNCYSYDIENISLSRFELISNLSLERVNFKDKIILCGLRNIGIATLIYLLDNNYKEITIYLRDKKDYMDKVLNILEKEYQVSIIVVDSIDNNISYNTYIDTTGSSLVIENIFKEIGFNKNIFLIGTPRESSYLIDPLLIHRNNLIVIGGHELRGLTLEYRNLVFSHLLDNNKSKDFLKELVSISSYSEENLISKLNNKSNFIEVFKYED